MTKKNPNRVLAEFKEFAQDKHVRPRCDLEIAVAWEEVTTLLSHGSSKRAVWEFLRNQKKFTGGYHAFLRNLKIVIATKQQQELEGTTKTVESRGNNLRTRG